MILLLTSALATAGCIDDNNVSYLPNTVFPAQFIALTQGKSLFVTSIGQSIDSEYLSLYVKDVSSTPFVEDKLLCAEEVANGAVVFVAVGCSLKSMSVSGVDKQSELARMQQFIERADSEEITLVAWHIGGLARRGNTSDSLIEYLFGNADLVLFTADGNFDLNLSNWALSGNVPYCQFVNNIKEMLRYLFGEVPNV